MSYTRLNYDDDTYKTKLNESISPGLFAIETPRMGCGSDCTYYAGGGVNLNRFDDGMCEKELIDVDSELIGITRKDSRCPARKYLPTGQPFCKTKQLTKDCTFMAPEPTLMSNPKATNKETTINRMQWLCQNPQKKALMPFDYNINNRLITKDNHRVCPPKPVDQSAALPPACNSFIRYDWSSKYTKPSNNLPGAALGYCDNIPKL
jgi:hypothetical protein